MATSDKLLVIQAKDWVVRVREFWVEIDLDSVVGDCGKPAPKDIILI
jgi:hypothetical protein